MATPGAGPSIAPVLIAALAAAALPAAEGWRNHAVDYFARVGEIVGALLAAIALAGVVVGTYRRTLGRRRDQYQRLHRLGTNAQLSFFASVLANPPAMRRSFDSAITRFDDDDTPYPVSVTFIEAVWIDRYFYVHAIADPDETVHAYSVTTRNRRFHPTFRPPGGTAVEPSWLMRRLLRREYRFKPNPAVTLGTTRFAELGPPQQAASWVGAHNAHYFEAYYFGNPGYYQHFVFSINDAGAWCWDAGFGDQFMHDFSWGFANEILDPDVELDQAVILSDVGESQVGDAGEADSESDDWLCDEGGGFEDRPLPARWVAFRRGARVNTYSVLGPTLSLDDYPLGGAGLNRYPTIFGVNSGRVRTTAET